MYRIDDQWHCITRTWLLWRDVFDVWSDDRFSWTPSGRSNRRGFSLFSPCVRRCRLNSSERANVLSQLAHEQENGFSPRTERKKKISCNNQRELFLVLLRRYVLWRRTLSSAFFSQNRDEEQVQRLSLPVTSRQRMVKSSFFSLVGAGYSLRSSTTSLLSFLQQ